MTSTLGNGTIRELEESALYSWRGKKSSRLVSEVGNWFRSVGTKA